MRQPWYLRPAALKIIARLRANPPQRRANDSTNPMLTTAGYSGFDAIALRDQFKKAFKLVYEAVPYNAAAASALMQTSADEVLAALFGCPDGLDWAHPERTARRTVIAIEIDAALGVKVAV